MSVFGVMYKIRLPFTIGSPLGELAPQVTEGLSRKSFTSSKRFHGVPLHQLRWSPSLKGRLILGSPLGELAPQVTEGLVRKSLH